VGGGKGETVDLRRTVPLSPGIREFSQIDKSFNFSHLVLCPSETISPVIPVVHLLYRTYKSTDTKFTLYKIYKGSYTKL
jgi:hypothetical protein